MVNLARSKRPGEKFPVVGLCASAGGLEAYDTFFAAMPSDSGMAFVVVQHLSPEAESILTELIQRCTDMPVHSITDDLVLQPNNVYVLLPGEEVTFWDGQLQVDELKQNRGWPNIIDRFLQSLARDRGERAAAVIFSGAGADGMEGARTIKANYGLVIAQEPESASQPSMPLHAIKEELADAVLTPGQIPAYLLEHFENGTSASVVLDKLMDTITEQDLHRIMRRMRRLTGRDFTDYKTTMFKQQVAMRIAAFQLRSVDDYLDHLEALPEEAEHLEKYLLIHVTQFFRDAEAFEVLKSKALLPMLRKMDIDTPFRAWVPGCASGEEAVSIAIMVYECLQELDRAEMDVRIFATDANRDVLRRARDGIYPASIANEISEGRLHRHFAETEQGYQVQEHISQMIMWAPHNLVEHPPFSNLHLVSCRNVLIYFQGRLRDRVFTMLQYSLVPEGILFLGSSETIPAEWNTIMPVDRFHSIYRQEADVKRRWLNLDQPLFTEPPSVVRTKREPTQPVHAGDDRYLAMIQNTLMAHYNTTCAIVDEAFQVRYTSGAIDRYLRFSPGVHRDRSILELAREGLDAALTLTLHRAFQTSEPIIRRGVMVQSDDQTHLVDLTIRPLEDETSSHRQRLIIFEQTGAESEHSEPGIEVAEKDVSDRPIQVRAELVAELRDAYEQVQMQNEELQTNNEEMQTLNEELNTINNQLIARNDELAYTHNTLHNILQSAEIGMMFLDLDLDMRSYTQAITQIFDLEANGDSHSLANVAHDLVNVDLMASANNVLDTLIHIEKEVQTRHRRWYIMHIRPYRTTRNIIDGLVMTFSEITKQKEAQLELRMSEQQQRELAARLEKEHQRLTTVLEHLPIGVWITDADGRVTHTTPLSDTIWAGTAPHIDMPEDYLTRYPSYNAETGEPLPLDEYPLMKTLRTRQRVPWVKLKIRRFDGSSAFIVVLAEPIWNSDGKLIGAVAIAQDVTEQERSKQQKADEDKDE